MFDATVLRNIAASGAGFWRIIIRIMVAGYRNICISALAAAELHKAINNHKLKRAERATLSNMLGLFEIVPFDATAAKVSGELSPPWQGGKNDSKAGLHDRRARRPHRAHTRHQQHQTF